jgi:hypothetical protein
VINLYSLQTIQKQVVFKLMGLKNCMIEIYLKSIDFNLKNKSSKLKNLYIWLLDDETLFNILNFNLRLCY